MVLDFKQLRLLGVWRVSARIEMGDKFTSSLSDAGELVLLIQDFSPADVGEYKVIVENELGAVSQIIRMDMSGNSVISAVTVPTLCQHLQFVIHRKIYDEVVQVIKFNHNNNLANRQDRKSGSHFVNVLSTFSWGIFIPYFKEQPIVTDL